MKVTISQTLDLEELPDYLMELTAKIIGILATDIPDNLESGVSENLRQQRFLAAAAELEGIRIILSRVDTKVAELRNLCMDYQQTLLKMKSIELSREAAAKELESSLGEHADS